ncbi:MAG: phytanoyl-CoA dioxygenase family protein [Gammaproteobacteria bacterium]|nr:phytanoyl-CoA dioxygenase family protein [Gammaproteobacteria bacterium]
MAQELSSAEVARYRRYGYLFPLDGFDGSEVRAINAALEQARNDARALGLEAELPQLLRSNVQYLLPCVVDVARAPPLLDRVASILGPDILLWSAEFFVKGAHTDKIVSWHQDLTYWGLGETDEEMTAWLALSDVSVESGCMRFIPGSHQQKILPHRDTFAESNLLSRGQEVAVDVDENDAVDVVLKPGQVSFHHGRIFHASGPNRSDHDRVGLVFRFLTPRVRQLVAQRDYAMLLRGIDATNNWIHVAPPAGNYEAASLRLREQVTREQSVALAAGAAQPMHAGYQAPD